MIKLSLTGFALGGGLPDGKLFSLVVVSLLEGGLVFVVGLNQQDV